MLPMQCITLPMLCDCIKSIDYPMFATFHDSVLQAFKLSVHQAPTATTVPMQKVQQDWTCQPAHLCITHLGPLLIAGLDQGCVQDRCHPITVIGYCAGVAFFNGYQVLCKQSEPELEASPEEHCRCKYLHLHQLHCLLLSCCSDHSMHSTDRLALLNSLNHEKLVSILQQRHIYLLLYEQHSFVSVKAWGQA